MLIRMWEVSVVEFPKEMVPVYRMPDASVTKPKPDKPEPEEINEISDNVCYLITLVAWAAIVMLGIIRGGI